MKDDPFIKKLLVFGFAGVASIAAGFFLRHWFIISKIYATPSWGLICTGISILVFIFIYFICDEMKITGWASFLRPAGENALTTYIAPDIIYYLIWMSGTPILIYKQSSIPLVVIAGSIAWALLMAGLTALLVRLNIRLKL